MKKLLKGVALVGAAALTVLGIAGTASCGDSKVSQKYTGTAEDLIKTLILNVDRTTVKADFELPAQMKSGDSSFDLTYSTTSTYLSFEKVTEGEKAPYILGKIVRPSWDYEDETVTARFTATVEVNGVKAVSDEFRVRIKRQEKTLSPADQFKKLYDEAGSKPECNIKGYVIAKGGHVVSGSYNNACLFVSDENGVGCYYAYNTGLTKEQYDALNIGDYVNITGTMTIYNGFVEINQGSKCTVDASHAKLSPLPEALDVTQMFFEKSHELFYKTASKVKLSGLKVKSLTEKAFNNATGKYLSTMQTVMTLERAGREINVVINEGMTPFADEATKTLFDGLLARVQVGDYVDVEGMLAFGGADEPVVFVNLLDQLVKTNAPEKTPYEVAAENLKKSVDKFDSQILKPVTIELEEGVTATIEGTPSTAAVAADGKSVTFTPAGTKESINITLTSKNGDITLTEQLIVKTVSLSEEEMIAAEVEDLTLGVVYYSKDGTKLQEKGKTYDSVKVTWALKEGEQPKLFTLSNNKVTGIKFGYNQEEVIKLVATVSCGDKSQTKELNLKFKTNATSLAEATTDAANGKVAIITAYVGESHTSTWDKGKATESTKVDGFWLRETADGKDVFEVYFGRTADDGKVFSYDGKTPVAENPAKGTLVTVIGTVYKYVGKDQSVTWEFSKTGALYDDVKTLSSLFATEYDKNAEVVLPLGDYTYEFEGAHTTAVLADGKVVITPAATKETVSLKVTLGDKTETITFETELPAALKAGEFVVAKGTNSFDDSKVNNKDAIKLGTSKAGGSFTITVGAGTTKISLYASAWKGNAGKLTISGATTTPTELSLTADDGLTNNSPFTLTGNESDYLFEITLTGITSETTLTFTSEKRAAIWGISAQ